MKVHLKRVKIQTTRSTELINITRTVKDVVKNSGVTNGVCLVFSLHTTTGVMINEAEPGLERDVPNFFKKLVPEHDNYYHHHYHSKDGRMAVNAWAHLRSILMGLFAVIPISKGELILGGRENIYLVELDGPQIRNVIVQVMGE